MGVGRGHLGSPAKASQSEGGQLPKGKVKGLRADRTPAVQTGKSPDFSSSCPASPPPRTKLYFFLLSSSQGVGKGHRLFL